MHQILILMASLSFSYSTAYAALENLESRVHSVELSEKAVGPNFIYLEATGRVLRVSPKQNHFLAIFQTAFEKGETLNLSWDDQGALDHLLSVKSLGVVKDLSAESRARFPDTELTNTEPVYETTMFTNSGALDNVFFNFRTKVQSESQCYQRAQLWSWEENQVSNIKLMKVFLFFTKRYIREYNYKWWFHVSPYALLDMGSGPQEYVLDRVFTNRPTPMMDWTNIFMMNDAPCKPVDRYADYKDNEDQAYCFLRKVPMYYFQPLNVEAMDRSIFVSGWINWEVELAKKARICGLFGCRQ